MASRHARRDLAIDAARGASMLFVIISHFGFQLVEPWSRVPEALGDRLTIIGMVASPSFMLVSGLTMATLAADPARFERLRPKLIDRGLFTLFVGHVLIGLADGNLLRTSPVHQNLAITDVVALATIGAALGRASWSARRCLAWAAALFALTWVEYMSVRPSHVTTTWLAGVLVGSHSPAVADRGFPLLPWLAVYLAGMALGKRRRAWPADQPPWRALGAIGLAAGGTGILLYGLRQVLEHSISWPDFGSAAYRLLSPLAKYPPGLVYLLCFGGAAVLVFAAVEFLVHETSARLPHWLAPLGRASLFTFIVQALVIQQLLPALHPDMRSTWPLWLAGSAALIYILAFWWQSRDLNRLFTLGSPGLMASDRRATSRRSRAS